MTLLVAGLCSVTLRALGIDEVTRLADECDLRAIEWGGDVHVSPGDAAAAQRARVATTAADLSCVSYGSYLLADGDASPTTVARTLDTALDLGAPNVRVWAPFGVEPGSVRTSEIVDALQSVGAAAADRELTVGVEYHAGTLTATADSTAALLDAVAAPNVSTYWQPPYWLPDRPPTDDAAEVAMLAPRLSHLHVYEWTTLHDRRPLGEGTERWRAVFRELRAHDSTRWCGPRAAFLEFVAGDDPVALARDARCLHELLAGLS